MVVGDVVMVDDAVIVYVRIMLLLLRLMMMVVGIVAEIVVFEQADRVGGRTWSTAHYRLCDNWGMQE